MEGPCTFYLLFLGLNFQYKVIVTANFTQPYFKNLYVEKIMKHSFYSNFHVQHKFTKNILKVLHIFEQENYIKYYAYFSVEVPSDKRVQRWALSIEELVSDPTGLQEFTSFLRKEYSHENIRFWLAVMDLRRSSIKQVPKKLEEIYE